jgi:beta-glucosidase-like glycosyl hydrolase
MGNAVFGDFDTALEELLRPYDAAINNGALTVMISFSSNNGKACHSDKYIITDVLKGKLGFNGIVVSDYEGVAKLRDHRRSSASAVNGEWIC